MAGGAVLNRGPTGLRFSKDLDIFHDIRTPDQDLSEVVNSCAESDANLLRSAGYAVEWTRRQAGHCTAVIRSADESVRLEWTTDSAARFFPAQPDEDFGYCLHPADLATNKVLALAGRSEIRDYLDILQVDASYLSFGSIVWAACGKDPGYTPDLIMDLTDRHSRYQESDLAGEQLASKVDLKVLKKQWVAAREGHQSFSRTCHRTS